MEIKLSPQEINYLLEEMKYILEQEIISKANRHLAESIQSKLLASDE